MAIVEQEITKSKIPLGSLEIRGYRSFKQLTISKLARVNLITGKNNVGKTSLLEAILLYARRGLPEAVWQVLTMRDSRSSGQIEHAENVLYDAVVRMFYGGYPILDWASDREIEWEAAIGEADLSFGQTDILELAIMRPKPETNIPIGLQMMVMNRSVPHAKSGISYSLARIIESERHTWSREGTVPCAFVPPQGLSREAMGQLWDRIAFSLSKQDIVTGLQIINPRVDDVSLFGETGVGLGRVANIKISGDFTRHPLSEFGDGMNRLFDNLVAMANVSDGILLIDEIENGLHYSILLEVWQFVFELARRQNIQVFATTHSWECIEAFQAAGSGSGADGALIRLQKKDDVVSATVFDKHRVAVAARDQIEVR